MADEPQTEKAKPARVDAKRLIQYFTTLKSERGPWDSLWQEIAYYIVPRRYPGMNGTVQAPDTETESRLFDTTAITAHQINAAGCLAWMTPETSPWFSFTPPARVKDESAKSWLGQGSQTGWEMLGRTNFYGAIHECYLDRSGPGTCCLYAERTLEGKLHFECWSVGTFVIEEDHYGRVNTVIREFKLTAEQAAEKFGVENLPKKMRKAAESGSDKALEKFEFLHFVMPRKKEDQAGGGSVQEQMPVACYYIAKDEKHLCKESGYPKMPCFVSRYLEWGTGTGGKYGWSPAFSALPEVRQVNWFQRNRDAYAEKMAFPPWIAPASLEGDIDSNAAGVTWVDDNLDPAKYPREMPVTGRFDVGKDAVMERQKAINAAFNVDMFQMLSRMEDRPANMTAREVAELASEKMIPFSPTFSRIKSEITNPFLEWFFDELVMAQEISAWEEIPESLQIVQTNGILIIPPSIQYNSRMEMAMQQLPVQGLYYTAELCAVAAAGQGMPPYDNIDWDKGIRSAARKYGVEADVIIPMQKVTTLRQERAEAQQAAEQMAAESAAADAFAKAGSVKSDSVVGKALEGRKEAA